MPVPVSRIQTQPQQFIAATSLSFDRIPQFSLHRMPVSKYRPIVGRIRRDLLVFLVSVPDVVADAARDTVGQSLAAAALPARSVAAWQREGRSWLMPGYICPLCYLGYRPDLKMLPSQVVLECA
jgi:hypothetical protein